MDTIQELDLVHWRGMQQEFLESIWLIYSDVEEQTMTQKTWQPSTNVVAGFVEVPKPILTNEDVEKATADYNERESEFVVGADYYSLRDSLWENFLQSRGVETPCKFCGGLGTRAYADTSTWHGGIGGQMVTGDVCDHCWGSGDENRHWIDLRASERARVSNEVERLRQFDEITRLRAELNRIGDLAALARG